MTAAARLAGFLVLLTVVVVAAVGLVAAIAEAVLG